MEKSGSKASGCKKSKERLTILFCSNADGTDKLLPLVIGKFKKPRCFTNININKLPVQYASNSTAWMNTDLFNKWLHGLDERMVKLNKKIILFLDNFSGHGASIELKNIKIAFYPPNCTSILQPLDQGIIRAFKSYYRSKLMAKLIARLDRQECEDGDINVLEAINMIGYSWNKVTQDTIRNCFVVSGLKGLSVNFPLLLKDKEETTNSDLIKTYCEIKKIQPISFDQYLDIDCKEITSAPLSDKDCRDVPRGQ
jgi:hypothetical protein